MGRLTTRKPVEEMGMYELAHNGCYISEDGDARYRDFEIDVDARRLTRELLEKFAEGDDAFKDDDDFDECMMYALQYGTRNIEGVIALFYRNLWAMAELRDKLAEYEDLEEQGLLLRLDSKDKLIEVLATKLLNTEFGGCYMCTNPMKNVTLDGIHNGCDGQCNVSEEFTVDDFLKKIVREMQRKEEALKKMQEGSDE